MDEITIEAHPAEIMVGETTLITLFLRNTGHSPCHNLILHLTGQGPGRLQGTARIHVPLLAGGEIHTHPLRILGEAVGEFWLRSSNFSYANPRPQRIRHWQLCLPIRPAPPPVLVTPPQLQLVGHQSALRQEAWGRLAGYVQNLGTDEFFLQELVVQPPEAEKWRFPLACLLAPGAEAQFQVGVRFSQAGENPVLIHLHGQSQGCSFTLQFRGLCQVAAAGMATTYITNIDAGGGVVIARNLPSAIQGQSGMEADSSFRCPQCRVVTDPRQNFCQNCSQSFIWSFEKLIQEVTGS